MAPCSVSPTSTLTFIGRPSASVIDRCSAPSLAPWVVSGPTLLRPKASPMAAFSALSGCVMTGSVASCMREPATGEAVPSCGSNGLGPPAGPEGASISCTRPLPGLIMRFSSPTRPAGDFHLVVGKAHVDQARLAVQVGGAVLGDGRRAHRADPAFVHLERDDAALPWLLFITNSTARSKEPKFRCADAPPSTWTLPCASTCTSERLRSLSTRNTRRPPPSPSSNGRTRRGQQVGVAFDIRQRHLHPSRLFAGEVGEHRVDVFRAGQVGGGGLATAGEFGSLGAVLARPALRVRWPR